MVMKWKVFLEGYLFSTINCDCDGTFEVDRKKMDIEVFIQGESSNKRKDIAFIWIGVLHAKSPRKIERSGIAMRGSEPDPHVYVFRLLFRYRR
jgi:hypothetical protein